MFSQMWGKVKGAFSSLGRSPATATQPNIEISRPPSAPIEIRAPQQDQPAVQQAEPVRPAVEVEVDVAPSGPFQAEQDVGQVADVGQLVADLPDVAVVTLEDFLAAHPPATPQGTAPKQVDGSADIKLGPTVAKAVDLGGMQPPRELGAAQLQAWLAAAPPDGRAAMTQQLERLAGLVTTGPVARGTSSAGPRTKLAQNLLLSYFVFGIGSFEDTFAIGSHLTDRLGSATLGDLQPDVQAALSTIGYGPTLERVEVFKVQTEIDAVGRIVRTAGEALGEQERHVKKIPGVEVPNFFMLVPESSRSKGGQQVSQINRLAARIVWQYEKRPDLGPLPALPATLHEGDPVIKRGEVAQHYQELVNQLQVRANALLPGELAEGKTGKERDEMLAEGRRVAEARGDLFSHGSGAQEKRGERYRPERIPFGLQQAANTQTGPGREQPARETGKAELDALHKAELDRARTEMRDMLSRKVPGFVVQRYASDVVDLLLKQFHVEALQEMQAEGWGTPPTEYAFLALGSGGRREHTSFGDLDFALVVGDTKKRAKKGEQKKTSKQYFQELGNRIAQKANGLGERGGAAQGGTERKGLRICEGGVFPAPSGQMPYGPEVLIGTPDDLAKVQKRPGWITFNQQEFELGADAELFDALREPRFAFGSTGGEALATKYQERLTKTMGQKGSTKQTRSVESGRVAIDEALAQARSLPSAASLQQAGAVFNVKKLSRPVQLYVKGMCLCAGVTVANSRDRIQELQKKGLLQPDLARQALDAVELIATLRLRAHLDAMEQHDELRATPSDEEGGEGALSGEDLTKVQAVITTLLPALGAAAQRALT